MSSDWDKEKFAIEIQLKERELALEEKKHAEDVLKRNTTVFLVPICLALIAAVATHISNKNATALQQGAFEADLMMEIVKATEPAQAKVNINYFSELGMFSPKTTRRIHNYYQNLDASGASPSSPPPLPLPVQPLLQKNTKNDAKPSSRAVAVDAQDKPRSLPNFVCIGGKAVDVPDSYPVEGAEKYFVPAEERKPGYLGGPPPMPK